MVIHKDSSEMVSKNFSHKEIYQASRGQDESFEFSDVCINAIQYIRDYFDEPIRITSTRRSKNQNALIGGSSLSQHITGNAIDWVFAKDRDKNHEKFYREIISGSNFLLHLLGLGVLGIGIYKSSDQSGIFCHLDDGRSHLNKRKRITAWDNRKVLDWGNIKVTSEFIRNLDLDNYLDSKDSCSSCKYDVFIDKLKDLSSDEIYKRIIK